MKRTSLAVLLLLALSTPALAQEARPDDGFRLTGTLGYPSTIAVGLGWKFPWHTELLLQGGGIALGFSLTATAEASVSQDVLRGRLGLLHVGLAASLLRLHAFAVDCYDGESCEDLIQNLRMLSPRLGGRLHLDRASKRRSAWYLELNGGPQFVFCDGCDRERWIDAAVNVRVVWDTGGTPAD